MPRLFEQSEDNDPLTSFRLAFGKAATATLNMTLANFLTWLIVNLLGGTKRAIIEIGDWNMDTTSQKEVVHGLTFSNIRNVQVLIRDDIDETLRPINFSGSSGTSDGSIEIELTDVRMTRTTSGGFDSADYDATTYNRGWIIIDYVP